MQQSKGRGHKERYANIELLRIFCTLSIIASHMIPYSDAWYGKLSFNKVVGILLASWSIMAVDIYVTISAFFLARSADKTFLERLRDRIWKLFRVAVESIILIVIAMVVYFKGVSVWTIKSAVLQTFDGTYWYIRTYLVLLLISPILDELIKHRKLAISFLVVTFALDCLPMYSNEGCLWKDIIQFACIYILAGLFATSNKAKAYSKKNWYAVLAGGMSLTQIFYWVMFMSDRFGGRLTIVPCHELTRRYSLIMVICALAVFMIVYNSKKFCSKFVCDISQASLAVYVWHASPIWQEELGVNLRIAELYETPCWIIGIIGVIAGIFIIFSASYMLGRKVIQKGWNGIKNIKAQFLK